MNESTNSGLPVSHLAIDTNALFGAGWPKPSVDLNNVAKGCIELGLPILIPDLVLWEAEAVWLRRTGKLISAVSQSIQKACALLGKSDAEAWPSEPNYAASYSASVSAVEAVWNWQRVPLPTLADAALRSANHNAPFLSNDVGFRDSLILWSLTEHVPKGGTLGLISSDKGISKPFVSAFAEQHGVSVRFFASVEEAWELVSRMLSASASLGVYNVWRELSERVKEAVRNDVKRLEAFIREQVPLRRYGIDGRVEAVRAFKVTGVVDAHAEFPPKQDPGDASATVELRVDVRVTTYEPATISALRVGQTMKDSPILGAGGTSMTTIEGFGTVRLSVRWKAEGEPPVIEYKAVELSTKVDEVLRRQALIDALSNPVAK